MGEQSPTPEQRRNYWFLIISCVGMQITSSTIYMVLPIFFQGYGINNSGVGILVSVGTLGGVVSGIIAGKLSDNIGRKPFLLIGGLMYGIVFFLFSFLGKDFNTFLVLRFIEGFAFYMVPVVVIAIAGDTFPRAERGRAIALYSMSSGVGQLIGPVFAGYFVQASDFNTYFIVCGIFSLISMVIVFFLVKETLDRSKVVTVVSEKKGFVEGVRVFLSQCKSLGGVFLIFLGATLLYRVGYTMIDPLFSLYLKNVLNLNISSMSYLFAVRALCTIVFAPICGWFADKFGRKPTFLIGMVLSVATMIGYSVVTSYEHVLIVRVLDSISAVVLLTVIRVIMTDLTKPELRGFGQGLYSSVTQETSTIGAIFGGVITDVWGFNGAFLTAAAGSALALVIVQIWVPEPARSSAPTKDSPAPSH